VNRLQLLPELARPATARFAHRCRLVVQHAVTAGPDRLKFWQASAGDVLPVFGHRRFSAP